MALTPSTNGLDGTRRLLVLAPHPDDETLSAAGLMQRSRAAGAAVRIVFLTDGDNNPWPQRWLERRWRIDAAARARWGRRRRDEARAAVARLGVNPDACRHFGWPDLGVTTRLAAATGSAVAELAAAIADFEPELIVAPALGDHHPDHSAAHVLLQLALMRLGSSVPVLCYGVHGGTGGATVAFTLQPGEVHAKREALLTYATQLSLSRGRLLAHVTELERFVAPPTADGLPPWRPPRIVWPALRLRVVRGQATWTEAWRGAAALQEVVRTAAGEAVYLKLESRLATPVIFDHWGWWRVA